MHLMCNTHVRLISLYVNIYKIIFYNVSETYGMFLYVTQTNTRLLKLCLLNVKHMLNIYAHVSLYRYTKYHKCVLPDI